jgi:hypothetical protein
VKQVIESLEVAKGGLDEAQCFLSRETIKDMLVVVKALIDQALMQLKAPRWETPEQYEKRTGEPWPDDWAVYALYETSAGEERFWAAEEYCYAQERHGENPIAIVCATEAGPPLN